MAQTEGVRWIKEVTTNLFTREWKVLRGMENARRRLRFRSHMRRTERTKNNSAPKEKSNVSQAIVSEAAQHTQRIWLKPNIYKTFLTSFVTHRGPKGRCWLLPAHVLQKLIIFKGKPPWEAYLITVQVNGREGKQRWGLLPGE